MIYNHTDAAGMSLRSSYTSPFPISAYGAEYDTNAAELDAGATNVGLVTTNNPQYGGPPENPIPLEAESVLSVDGQRVTCDLDGLAISCSQVRNRLENGSAVPPLIDEILRAAGGRDINLQYSGGGRFTFRDFNYDGPGRRSIGLTFNFLVNFFTQPQTSSPPKLIDANKEQQDRFNNAWADILERLKKPECAKLFGGYDNAVKTLNLTDFLVDRNLQPIYELPGGGALGLNAIVNNYSQESIANNESGNTGRIRFNGHGGFFANNGQIVTAQGNKIDYGQLVRAGAGIITIDGNARFYGSLRGIKFNSDVAGAAFILLHELAHRTDPSSNDSPQVENFPFERIYLQAFHNQKVLDACFSDDEVKTGRDFVP